MPIIRQPVFDLEPLPRQPHVVDRGGGDEDGFAERLVFGLPCQRHRRGVGHRHGPVEMVGVDVVERRCPVIDRQRRVAEPDILFQDAAGRVVLGDDVAEAVPDVMRRADRAGLGFDPQPLEAVIEIGADRSSGIEAQLLDAAGVVDGVIVGVRPAQVLNDIARRIVSEDALLRTDLYPDCADTYLA